MEQYLGEGRLETEQTTEFRTPEEFSHTGTDMAQGFVYGNYSGAPEASEPTSGEVVLLQTQSYYNRGYYGVQVKEAIRTNQGWRTWEEIMR